VLRRPVRAHQLRADSQRPVGDRSGEVHRQRDRVAEPLGALQHRLQQLRSRDPPVGSDHVPVRRAAVPGELAFGERFEADRLVEGVRGVAHRAGWFARSGVGADYRIGASPDSAAGSFEPCPAWPIGAISRRGRAPRMRPATSAPQPAFQETRMSSIDTRTHAALHRPALAATQAPAVAPRFDMYMQIHKGLRTAMAETLLAVGRMDWLEREERDATLGRLAGLLALCRSHLEHENQFVHTAIEQRLPGAAGQTEADHLEHVAAIDHLRRRMDALRQATDENAGAAAL